MCRPVAILGRLSLYPLSSIYSNSFMIGHPQKESTGILPQMSGSDLIKWVGTCLDAPVMTYLIAYMLVCMMNTVHSAKIHCLLYSLPCSNYHMFLSSNIAVAWHEIHKSERLHQLRRSRWLRGGLDGFRETRAARSHIALFRSTSWMSWPGVIYQCCYDTCSKILHRQVITSHDIYCAI